jgi:hypothetical protein
MSVNHAESEGLMSSSVCADKKGVGPPSQFSPSHLGKIGAIYLASAALTGSACLVAGWSFAYPQWALRIGCLVVVVGAILSASDRGGIGRLFGKLSVVSGRKHEGALGFEGTFAPARLWSPAKLAVVGMIRPSFRWPVLAAAQLVLLTAVAVVSSVLQPVALLDRYWQNELRNRPPQINLNSSAGRAVHPTTRKKASGHHKGRQKRRAKSTPSRLQGNAPVVSEMTTPTITR